MTAAPLRVLHLGKYYPPVRGGIETVLEALCTGDRQAVESRALVLGKGRRTRHEIVDGVAVTRVGALGSVGAVSVTPTLPWRLARAGARADVLVLHEPNPMALLAYFVARPSAPLVVWFHSEVIRPRWRYRLFYEPLLEFALRRARRVVVASPPMLDVPALARHRAKGVVIPYGLDPAPYPDPFPAGGADAVPAGAVRPTVLFVGRLVAYKGVDVLVRAMQGLDAEAVIIGDGPRRASLESMAADLGVSDRVRFLGQVSDDERMAWYRRCDVFALPSVSRQEAFGMVQIEAMLCGRPVVSTALGTGVPWVNQHERTGLVVAPGDALSLHAAIARLMADPGLRRRLGHEGRDRALALFTAGRMCGAASSLYRDVARASLEPHGAEPARAS